jgi:hypothetical protein
VEGYGERRTCALHRVALEINREEIAAVFSGVATRAPLIVTCVRFEKCGRRGRGHR